MKPFTGAFTRMSMSSLFCSGTASSLSASVSPPAMPGAAMRRGIRYDLGATAADMRVAAQPPDMALPADRRIDIDPRDIEPGHVDIEIGQQRRLGIGRRLERGHPQQPHFGAGQAADVDMVAQIGERPPVDCDLGRGGEHALGVADLHVAQHHRAEERSLDPADTEVEPRGERQPVDLLRDEIAARLGVDPDDQHAQRQHHHAEHDSGPFDDSAPHGPLLLGLLHRGFGRVIVRGFGRIGRHQKACPIEM